MSIVDNLQKMLDGGRDDAMLRFGLGSGYFNQDDFQSAVTHLEQCLAHDETYSAAYKLLGKALYKMKEYDRAQAVFDKGLTVAAAAGDKQTVKEITVFLKKVANAES